MHRMCLRPCACCDCNSNAEVSSQISWTLAHVNNGFTQGQETEIEIQQPEQHGDQSVAVVVTQPNGSSTSVRDDSIKGSSRDSNIIPENNEEYPEEQFVDINIKIPSMDEDSRYGDIAEMIFKRNSYFNT